jgi:CheY-like chemotaxis protein
MLNSEHYDMSTPRLLVASESVDDAELVRDLLRAEFQSVEISCAATAGAEDFERVRPQVVLLAFETLEKAKLYCAALDRSPTKDRLSVHRTIALCTRNELREAYALCRARSFDDYVLFWPMNHDAPRLLMAVHQALLFIGMAEAAAVSTNESTAEGRSLTQLQEALEALLRDSDEGMANAGRSVDVADAELKRALGLEGETWLGAGDASDERGQRPMRARLERLHRELIAPPMREASVSIAEARRSLNAGRMALAPRHGSNQRPHDLAGRARPSVLVVDDDETQCKLISQALSAVHILVRCSLSGEEALRALRESRPDVILMDIDLPDTNGIELTRVIRTVPGFAKVPVVMITGHSDKDAVMGSLGAGATGFLVKPLTRQKLYGQINAVLGWKATPAQSGVEIAEPAVGNRVRTLSELA